MRVGAGLLLLDGRWGRDLVGVPMMDEDCWVFASYSEVVDITMTTSINYSTKDRTQ